MAAAGPAAAAEETGAEAQPRLALMAVTLNTVDQGEPIWLLRDAQGAVFVPLSVFAAWRLKPGPARRLPFQDATYVAIDEVPGVTAQIDEATQSLHLTVDPASFDGNRIAIANKDARRMTPSGTGGFLNYDVVSEIDDGQVAVSGAFEVGAFTHGGTGSTTFIGRMDAGGQQVTRLETSWTIDDPQRMRSMRIGDSITRGGIGSAPLRFAGFQIASNFATQPGFVTMALPTLGGSAAVPSVVDIYVNNVLQSQQHVAPGPFQLTDVPVVTGSGDIQLVVRDTLGRETLVNQSYYAAPQLIRRGLSDYSYEIGFLRQDFAVASNHYGAAMVSATHRYGLTDTMTIEGHAEATVRTQMGSVAVNLLWPEVGIFSLSAAASRAGSGEGTLFGAGFERRTRGLSFGASGEVAMGDYETVGSLPDLPYARSTGTVFVGLPTRFGSVSGSFLWRHGRGQPDAAFLGASTSVRVRGFGSISLSARQSFSGVHETAGQIYLSVPLGRQSSASASVQVQAGGMSATAGFQKNLPEGPGIGYRASASIGQVNRLDGTLSAQTGYGNLDAEVTWVDGRTGVRLTASGSIATVGGQVFAARRLNQSFAAVQVGDYGGVRVYADNQLIGRTNGDGVAIIPRLRAFQDNRIRIAPEDLPLDVTLAATEQTVRPFDRSGVVLGFSAVEARDGLMTVVTEDGQALPTGTAIILNGRPDEFVAAPGGQLYLTGLLPRNVAVAAIGASRCSFRFAFASGLGPQPQLGQFKCATVSP